MRLRIPQLSIRTWLFWMVLAFTLPLYSYFFRHLVVEEERNALAAAYAEIDKCALSTASALKLTLKENQSVLHLIADAFAGNPPYRSGQFDPRQFMAIHPQLVNLSVHDIHGNTVYSYLSHPVSASQAKGFPWLQAALASPGFSAGNAFLGPVSGQWVSVLSYPVLDSGGQQTGIVSAHVGLQRLTAGVLRDVPSGCVVEVIDAEGKFLMRSIEAEKWIGRTASAPPDQAQTSSPVKHISMRSAEGVSELVSVVSLSEPGWRVLAGVSEAEAMESFRISRNHQIALAVVLFVLGLILAHIVATFIAHSIQQLAHAAARVAGGEVTFRPVPYGPKEVVAVTCQFNDMLNAQLESTRKLQEAEARWKFALESAGEAVWDWDIPSGRIYYSESYRRMLGEENSDALSSPDAWSRRVHPDDLPQALASVQKHLDGLTDVYVAEYRIRRADGVYIWNLARGLVVARDAQGGALRVVGVNTDIDQRKRVESDLRIGAVAFESQHAMYVTDSSKQILRVNQAFTSLLGYTIQDIRGARPDVILDNNKHDAQIQAAIWRRVDSGKDSIGEIFAMCKSGKQISAWAKLTAVKDLDGVITHYVGSLVDITERKRLEVLRESAAVDQKNALIREVHHRIKNNLQGIIGILREFGRTHPDVDATVSNVVAKVQSIAVIHGLQGRSVSERVRLCEMTQAIADGVASLWSCCIEVDIPQGWCPRFVSAQESVSLALVLNELILNAVKHRDVSSGKVWISVREGTSPYLVRVCIANVGIWHPTAKISSVGLQLVATLMPRDGALLTREVKDGQVITSLELGDSVVSIEGDATTR